jgi:hypothetical protein
MYYYNIVRYTIYIPTTEFENAAPVTLYDSNTASSARSTSLA